MLDSYLSALCQYAVRTGLIQPDDVVCCRNALLDALGLDSFDETAAPAEVPLADILQALTDDAVLRGVPSCVLMSFARCVSGQSGCTRSVRHETHGHPYASPA